MQKHKPYYTPIALIALIVFTAIGGCKKDSLGSCGNGKMDVGESGVDCGGGCKSCSAEQYRVKSVVRMQGGDTSTTNLFYTENGLIDSTSFFVRPANAIYSISKFIYSNNQVSFTNDNSGVIGVAFYRYTLNSSGYAVKLENMWYDGDVYYTKNLTYDAEWHLLEDSFTTYANGNKVTGLDVTNTYYTYTYNTDKLNTISNENKGQKFLGRESINVLASQTKPGRTITYNCQYDSLDRLVRVTEGGMVTTYNYY